MAGYPKQKDVSGLEAASAKLPREVVKSSPLVVFKKHADVVLQYTVLQAILVIGTQLNYMILKVFLNL